MSASNIDSLVPTLRDAGQAVASLSRPPIPEGLAQRTLERVIEIKPIRRKPLMLRPITHALARFAAVAILMVMTLPLTYLDVVDSLGRRIENNLVGPRVVDRVEQIVDGVLTTDSFSQVDQYSNIHNATAKPVKRAGKSKPNSRI
jgi:hypothetical protein